MKIRKYPVKISGRDSTVVARIRINKVKEMGELRCRVYEGKKRILQKPVFTYKETFPAWRILQKIDHWRDQMEREKREWER